MGRPRQVSDEEILVAARACFLEHGAQVSTAHIASEIGVSQAALFKRFHTKENLLLTALTPHAEPRWLEAVVSGPDARPLPDQLVEIGGRALAFMRELVPCMMVLSSAGLSPEALLNRFDVPPPVLAHRLLGQWFEQAREEGRLQCTHTTALAMQFLGSLHVRAFLSHKFESHIPVGDDATYVRQVVDTLWRGIAPAEDP